MRPLNIADCLCRIREKIISVYISNRGITVAAMGWVSTFIPPAWLLLTDMKAEKTNTAMAKSFVGQWFRLEFSGHEYEKKGTRFLTELRAGLATFFAMAYIISVNASIVADTGGTCICTSTSDPTCANDTAYLQCVQEINRDLVTATSAISCLTTLCMGFLANMPIALA